MKIKKLIESPDGSATIEGEFTPEEVQVIIEVGLNALYQTGALPFKSMSQEEMVNFQPYNGESQ